MTIRLRGLCWIVLGCLCLVPGVPAAHDNHTLQPARLAPPGPRARFGVACQGGVFEVENSGDGTVREAAAGSGSAAEWTDVRDDRPGPGRDRVPSVELGLQIEVFNGQVALLGLTSPVPAHLRRSGRGTEVHARWPRSERLPQGARLDALIEPTTCTTMRGFLQTSPVPIPAPFQARSRLLSGDGTVGGGEGGDPDGGSTNTGGHKGFQRWYAQYVARATPAGLIPPDALEHGFGQVALAPIAPVRWVSLGPAPQREKPGDPSESPSTITSGRVDALAVDPADPGHWLIGAATGGVWETRDAGGTWAPRTDDQPSLAISALAFAPNTPNVVYAGTGAYTPLQGSPYAGVGILKSIDGGKTWGRFGASVFTGLGFGGIAVSPATPTVAVAATLRVIPMAFLGASVPPSGVPGIYRTDTGGASWDLRLRGYATSVVAHPTSPFFFLYAGLARPATAGSNFLRSLDKVGVYRSLDAGQTWQAISGPWTSKPGGIGEVRLAVSPSSPGVLYVSIRDATNGTAKDGYLLGVWRTSNAWDPTPTWTELPAPVITPFGTHALLVHGTDPDVVYLASGGPPLWKYVDGQWLAISQSDPGDPNSADLIHVDHRSLAWVGTQSLLVGNDGGVYLRNEATGGPWLARNDGLAITQFYGGAVLPDDPTVALGGAQDNSVSLMLPPAGPTWKVLSSGDGNGGFFGVVPQRLAYFLQYGIVQRSLDGGATSFNGIAGIPSNEQGGGWLTRAVRCPASENVVLYGAGRLWKSTNFFAAANFQDIAWTSKTSTGPVITGLAFAPSDPSCATYAFTRFDGSVYLTINDGAQWTLLDPGEALPSRVPTSVAFGPASADTLWVAFSGYDAGTPGHPGHLFRTDSATSPSPTWTDVSPPVDLPHNVVAVHPTDPGTVYVGCDLGAWVTSDGGATWQHNGPSIGLPNVPVMDIRVTACSATAFTYGRGAFRTVTLGLPCP